MTGPLRVSPLIENTRDGDVTHAVEVSLTDVAERQLFGDIAARATYLHEQGVPIFALMLLAGQRPCTLAQQDALTDLVRELEGVTHQGSEHTLPPVWTLTPKQGGRFLCDTAYALDPPVQCRCGRYVPQPSQLTDVCDVCDERADLRLVGGAS